MDKNLETIGVQSNEINDREIDEKIQKIQKFLYENFKKIIQGNERNKIDFGELKFFLEDPDFFEVQNILNNIILPPKELSRAIGCFICGAIGDALGTHMEFKKVDYNRQPIFYDFDIKKKNRKIESKRLANGLCKLGQFSDDTSMALCLADHLLFNNFQFDYVDLQIKFLNWWFKGYNNCLDDVSFGLGGNIWNSMKNFLIMSLDIYKNDNDLLNLKEKLRLGELDSKDNISGNGSIMRLAPVPIAFASRKDLFNKGVEFAAMQSKVTHSGIEAQEACRLLAHLIMKLINCEEFDSNNIKNAIDNSLIDFKSENYSVGCLKNSQKEDINQFRCEKSNYFDYANRDIEDRNWNWREKDFRYSPTRESIDPCYIGSYALDGLAMALHISYYSENAKNAIIKAANMGGDCDTVASIVGQIVGAFYGLEQEILDLYEGVRNFDKGKIAYMAYKLYKSQEKQNFDSREDLKI